MNLKRKQTTVTAFLWDGNEDRAIKCFSDGFDINFNSGNMMLTRGSGTLTVEPGNYVIVDEIDNIFVITPNQAKEMFVLVENAHAEQKNTKKQAKTVLTTLKNAHGESNLDILTNKAKENANE